MRVQVMMDDNDGCRGSGMLCGFGHRGRRL